MSDTTYSRKVAVIGYLILALITLSVLELASFVVVRLDIGPLSKYLVSMPSKSAEDFHKYIEQRDDLLGWPSLVWKNDQTSADGSRVSPANEVMQNTGVCISLYGDSFTFADEVDHDRAWGNLLAEKLGCQVKNYGVNGFGTGQAILRFEQNEADFAGTVILGLFPDDLNRIQNQWRHLLTGNNPFGFKPSFSVNSNGKLVIHEIPVNSYEDYMRILEFPESILTNEFYLPGQSGFLSRIKVGFPYTLVMTKLGIRLLQSIDFAKIPTTENIRHINYPGWYDSADGPDIKKIQVFSQLVKHFSDKTMQRKQKGVLLLIPDPEMVRDVQRGGEHVLYDDLEFVGELIKFIDATQYLAKETLQKGVCYYYGKSRDCTGHLNKEGNQLLATYVHTYLENRQ